ncbi:MAG: extracellular solute-binding protein, partial [Clostridia bacterium]|nr:extracellular solute-binding protein [Clostridia bacterium]
KNDMITGKININFAWSGDAVYAMDEAEDQGVCLNYSVPVEGSNIFFDGWVMPKGANTTLAEEFVNYISMPENACANMDYIGYTSVIAGDEVFDRMVDYFELTTADDYANLSADEQAELTAVDLSYFFDDISDGRNAIVYTDTVGRQFYAQYPDFDTINRCAIMNYFDNETNEKISILWENVKGTELPIWVLVLLGALVVVYVGQIIAKKIYKKNRAKYIAQTRK